MRTRPSRPVSQTPKKSCSGLTMRPGGSSSPSHLPTGACASGGSSAPSRRRHERSGWRCLSKTRRTTASRRRSSARRAAPGWTRATDRPGSAKMIDSELPTDLRRPCTPSRGPASPTPRNLRFRGDPGSAVTWPPNLSPPLRINHLAGCRQAAVLAEPVRDLLDHVRHLAGLPREAAQWHADDVDACGRDRGDLFQAAGDRAVHRRQHVADLKRGRVAAHGHVAVADLADGGSLLLQGHAVDAEGHPAIAQCGHAPHEPRRELAREPDRDPIRGAWPRLAVHAIEVHRRGVKAGGCALPERTAGAYGVLHELATIAEADAKSVVLVPVPAWRHAHHEPAARQGVQGGA